MNAFTRTVTPILLLVSFFVVRADAADWHYPLYLDGGGFWRARIPVTVHNEGTLPAEGEPVAIVVGNAGGQAAVAGERAEAIRVCNHEGAEMLFALQAPDGAPVTRGPIPGGSTLVLPVECPAQGTAVHYIYFDNPLVGEVPDFLSARMGLVNGDVELGDGDVPSGWRHDTPDDAHRATWSREHPQSGQRCLKTVVSPGAEPTWIATRQHGIHIVGGAKYAMRAWVKAENVEGFAGWYIHVGNRDDPMLISPMLSGGDGTYDWKQVTAQFTAPAEANRADLGTVLRGTGTAWFDNVALECLEPGKLRAEAGRPERASLKEIGLDAPWDDRTGDERARGEVARTHRALVRVFNFSSEPTGKPLVAMNLGRLEARMRGRLDRESIRVTLSGRPVEHFFFGDVLLFAGRVPAHSANGYYVYFSADRGITSGASAATDASAQTAASGHDAASPDATAVAHATALLTSQGNLVKNPGFEQGDPLPDAWTASGPPQGPDGITYGFDAPRPPIGRGIADLPPMGWLGKRSAKMHVPHGSPEAWRGWQQGVPVRPGRTYLLAAWVKCEDVQGGDVRLHAHRHTADGKLSEHSPMVSCGSPISGTTGWTLMSGRFTMPEDTVNFRLHLTMNATGTVWHDGVLLTEIFPGKVGRLEGRPVEGARKLSVWQVPAVVKLFRDDPAPQAARPARISAARNEKEPIQLAVRSARALRGVRVEVDPPTGPNGAKLDDVEVNVVGYVPIDYATNYYRSDSPPWHRKIPSGQPRSDGWAGLWPDPLLPRDTFDLEPNATQPIWITVGVGKDAAAGDYSGTVRLVSGGQSVAEVPFVVHVWDFALPDESHVAAIYDVRLGRGSDLWGKPMEEIYPEIIRFMAERRLCPDTIRPTPAIRLEDGRLVADFTEFDRAAGIYFDQLRFPFAYTPWQFYLFGWGHPPKTIFGERPYPGDPPYEGADRSKLRPEYKRAYQAFLKAFWDHLKEKGWAENVVLYISDEPFDRHEHIREQMKALCDMIHEVDPEIPIYSSTWKHVPEWDGYLDVWGIGHYGRVAPEKMAELRAAGDRLWFTTDGQMCTDTPYCAVERLLPHYCFQYDVEAYEFWGVAWLTYDPYRFGWHSFIHQSSEPGRSYWVRYPNGDGFLLYPGGPIGYEGLVSSLRFEQAREGVEDYEYLYLLRRLIREAKSAGRDTTQAENAMAEASELVSIPNAGGLQSSNILPDPEAVYRVRRSLAAAIEKLTR
jgi:hypothetical protein